jgi:nicotinamide riboside kinase
MKLPKRILILGPESSGKSTLAEALAQHFQEPWVPEVARQYLQDVNRPYDFEDLLHLGKQQMRLEDEQASKAKSYLFCDTDLRVIQVWSLHRFGKIDPWVREELGRRTYDLILLCAPDYPGKRIPCGNIHFLNTERDFLSNTCSWLKTVEYPTGSSQEMRNKE